MIITTLAVTMIAVLVGAAALIHQRSSTQATSPPADVPAFPSASSLRPIPTSTTQRGPQQVAALGDHPLSTDRNTGLYDIACTYAPWASEADQARRFYESALACMNKAWRTVTSDKILPFSEPNLEVPTRAALASSPCTRSSTNSFAAFYCPTNHTIYMPMDTIGIDQYGDDSVIYLGTLAHEYGHHVQSISGITSEANMKRWIFGDGTPDELDMSRRLELQAQCFAGMFFVAAYSSLSPAQYTRVISDRSQRGDYHGDSPDHGSPQNNGAWVKRGTENSLAECNTWSAPASSVS
ncbi:neutral zinc metallopeptidase [Nocardia sp. NPDC058518]|uniref:neutral zinc metallopeptidase n=1 Tax=Nocardia sp. NPDC058518 TaxID=3346534 RepID=UPI00364A2705